MHSCARTERCDVERFRDLVDLRHERRRKRHPVLLPLAAARRASRPRHANFIAALNTSGGTKRATSRAITNCPTLSSPSGGAAKSRMSRPKAAPLSGPANSPMTIESPLPL
jgi:hypothetical protein